MAIAYVQDTGKVSAEGVNTSTSGAFGTQPTVGNHIIVTGSGWNNANWDLTAVTDNQGNTYAIDAEVNVADNDPPDTPRNGAFIASTKIATSSGSHTVTVDPQDASGNYIEWTAIEFSGLHATTHLHKTGTNSGYAAAGTDASVTASTANTVADCLVVAVCSVSNNDSALTLTTPTTGYTAVDVNQDAALTIGYQSSYKTVSGTETSSATWTHDNTSAEGWAAAIATYAIAAGGGGGTTPKNVFGKMLSGPFGGAV